MRAAVELAIVRARQDAADSGGSNTPRSITRLLRFSRLPSRAVRTVVDTLDQDEAFRSTVSKGLALDEPDRASWLFLTRPEDWDEELALISEAAAEELEESTSVSQLRASERQLEATRASLEQFKAELVEALSKVEQLESDSVRTRLTVSQLEAEVEERAARLDELEIERSRVIKNLKGSETLAAQRLGTIRQLQEEIAAITASTSEQVERNQSTEQGQAKSSADTAVRFEVQDETSGSQRSLQPVARQPDGAVEPRSAIEPFDRNQLGSAFGDAVEALNRLASAFERAAGAVLADGSATDAPPVAGGPIDAGKTSDESASRERWSAGQRRRSPVRLRRGAIEGSPEGIAQILGTADVVVFVDGYNVAMEAWPNLSKSAQRETLIQLTGTVAARCGAEFHLVFDGAGDGERPSVATALPVRIHFSDVDTEADDVILDFVRLNPQRPVLVVSSDKRVESGSRRLGANSVTSTQLLNFARTRLV